MLDPETRLKLKELLVKHEGKTTYPYVDTVGKITIGIGYNLTDRGLPEAWVDKQFEEDVNFFHDHLDRDFKWFRDLNYERKIVLIDMCFMGYQRFKEFKNMLKALSYKNYDKAADEMLNSKWAIQVGNRALELANIMRTGTI